MRKLSVYFVVAAILVVAVSVWAKDDTVRLPDVIGMKAKGAVLVLENAGLRTSTVVVTEKGNPGTVVSVSAANKQLRAWQILKRGTMVSVCIVKERRLSVPDLSGKTEQEAQSILKEADLVMGKTVKEPSEEKEPGQIFRQHPKAGESVDEETVVSVTIAEKVLVSVPDLMGLTISEVRTKISDSSLVLGTVREEEKPGIPVGVAYEQSPKSGSKVEKQSAVDVIIAKEPLVSVPDLLGTSSENAKMMLSRADLTLGAVEERISKTEKKGTVLEQDPRALTKVFKGTAVSLVIAKNPPPEVPRYPVTRSSSVQRTTSSYAPASPEKSSGYDRTSTASQVSSTANEKPEGSLSTDVTVQRDLPRIAEFICVNDDRGVAYGATVSLRCSVDYLAGGQLTVLRDGTKIWEYTGFQRTHVISVSEPIIAKTRFDLQVTGTVTAGQTITKTATVDIKVPFIRMFRSLKSTLAPGESSVLRWDISGLGNKGKVTLMVMNGAQEQIVAKWEADEALTVNEYPVTPASVHVENLNGSYGRVIYRLVAENPAGRHSHEAVLYISGGASPAGKAYDPTGTVNFSSGLLKN